MAGSFLWRSLHEWETQTFKKRIGGNLKLSAFFCGREGAFDRLCRDPAGHVRAFLIRPSAGFLLYRKEELPAVLGFLFAASSAGGLVFGPLSGKSVLEDMGHFRDALFIYDKLWEKDPQ